MIQECRLYLIEDKPERHMAMSDIIAAANSSNDIFFNFIDGNLYVMKDKWRLSEWALTDDVFQLPQDENLNSAIHDIWLFLKNKDYLIRAILDEHSIIFLDLELKSGFSPGWYKDISKCAEEIEQFLCNEHPNAIIWANALENKVTQASRLSSLVAGARIALNLPLIFVSTICERNFRLELDGSLDKKAFKTFSNFPVIGKKPVNPNGYSEDIDILLDLVKDCAKGLTKYHTDHCIDKSLKMFGSIYNSKIPNPWTHNSMNDYEDQYIHVVMQWLGRDQHFNINDINDIKPLLMLTDTTNITPNVTHPYQKENAVAYDTNYKTIKGWILRRVLLALGIPFDNSVPDNDDLWYFPITPGIVFLLALKEFICVLSKKENPRSIKFEKFLNTNKHINFMFSITIQLAKSHNGVPFQMFNFGTSYERGDGLGEGREACKALRHLLNAKLDVYNPLSENHGIKSNEGWLHPLTGFLKDTNPLNGRDHGSPCVGVCFYPYAIRFVWSGDE